MLEDRKKMVTAGCLAKKISTKHAVLNSGKSKEAAERREIH
jgi:hypothetical protein